MTQARSLFPDVAGPCPTCGHGLEFADITLVANCHGCESTWWRDDEHSPWETFVGAFGRPERRPKRRNAAERQIDAFSKVSRSNG